MSCYETFYYEILCCQIAFRYISCQRGFLFTDEGLSVIGNMKRINLINNIMTIISGSSIFKNEFLYSLEFALTLNFSFN